MTDPEGPDLFSNLNGLWRQVALPLEIAAYHLRPPRSGLPRGKGYPVLLIPGFGFGERILRPLMRSLTALDHAVFGWGEGLNLGLRLATQRRLGQRLEDLHRQYGVKVNLIGWSLGGIVARDLAHRYPTEVRRIILLGAPLRGFEHSRSLLDQTGVMLKRALSASGAGELRPPPRLRVPSSSIFSKSDGVVDWRQSLERPGPSMENLEVSASHIGLLHSPEVLALIATRLAGPVRHGK